MGSDGIIEDVIKKFDITHYCPHDEVIIFFHACINPSESKDSIHCIPIKGFQSIDICIDEGVVLYHGLIFSADMSTALEYDPFMKLLSRHEAEKTTEPISSLFRSWDRDNNVKELWSFTGVVTRIMPHPSNGNWEIDFSVEIDYKTHDDTSGQVVSGWPGIVFCENNEEMHEEEIDFLDI